jgi:hypothetical protein
MELNLPNCGESMRIISNLVRPDHLYELKLFYLKEDSGVTFQFEKSLDNLFIFYRRDAHFKGPENYMDPQRKRRVSWNPGAPNFSDNLSNYVNIAYTEYVGYFHYVIERHNNPQGNHDDEADFFERMYWHAPREWHECKAVELREWQRISRELTLVFREVEEIS